jgi:hypothetical protein
VIDQTKYADALLYATQVAMEGVIYRLLIEAQKYKTFPFYMGTADLQAVAREVAYEYKMTLKRELENADNLLRAGGGGGTD